MAQLIQPILDTIKKLLESMDTSTLGELPAFVEVRSAGVMMNFPFASVEPGRTTFDPEADQSVSQVHEIVLKVGVDGSEPEEMKTRLVAYALAVWKAFQLWKAQDWPTPGVDGMQVLFAMILSIDYTVTYTQGSMLSRYVEISVGVRVEELP